MRTLSLIGGLALFLSCATAGCTTPSRVAEHHGDAQRANRDAMIENPVPSRAAVEGLDPRSAEHVLENYSEGQGAQKHVRDRTIFGEID